MFEEELKSSYALEMMNISKAFSGVQALSEAKLKVRPGTVHSLVGENGAGKSTLMKCLFGIYKLDAGEIYLSGNRVKIFSPQQALKYGISMVHQELNQVRQMNIMDNIWLGRYPKNGIFIDTTKCFKETQNLFETLKIELNPQRNVSSLSISEMQLVEIAKAVSSNSKIIVMDEPTSSLTVTEVEHLFSIINLLKTQNVGVIYISHKIEEVLDISDEITIMRDGFCIATRSSQDLTKDEVIEMMVDRKLSNLFPHKVCQPGKVILEVKNLTAYTQPSIKDINFKLRAGEILGIAGLVGAKRTDILEGIFGIRKLSSGEIILDGKKIDNSTIHKAISQGFALVTEERRSTGIFASLSVSFNATIANINYYVNRWGLLSEKKIRQHTQDIIDSMEVKTPSQKTLIGKLSGGNQQKVIVGRWLLTKPKILMLDEPTRGIDVGAKYEIYKLINDLANKGMGIIMVSSEMPELLGVTDRILVMSNGRVAGIVESKNMTQKNRIQEEIMHLSGLYL
ncbi:MAG: ATP-binding cassette domain-containing protein [Okeania sp. SIO3B3]|nr:ATP-binding cassette domain-containing protein [Okeania sp. SIO3B3]